MICSKCNTHNDNASKFCKTCGTKFIGLENSKSDELKNIVAPEKNGYCISCGTSIKSKIKYCPSCGSEQHNNVTHTIESRKTNSSRMGLNLLGIGVLLLVIVLAYFYLDNKNMQLIKSPIKEPSTSENASYVKELPKAQSPVVEELGIQAAKCLGVTIERNKFIKFLLLTHPELPRQTEEEEKSNLTNIKIYSNISSAFLGKDNATKIADDESRKIQELVANKFNSGMNENNVFKLVLSKQLECSDYLDRNVKQIELLIDTEYKPSCCVNTQQSCRCTTTTK